MLIKIGKNGERRVSITKPERKKLTDALEFLELVSKQLHIVEAYTARIEINKVLVSIDTAVATSGAKAPIEGQQVLPHIADTTGDTTGDSEELPDKWISSGEAVASIKMQDDVTGDPVLGSTESR